MKKNTTTNIIDLTNKLQAAETEKLIKDIAETLRAKDKLISTLRQEISLFTDELYKDEHIKELDKIIKELREENSSSFIVTKKEWKKINEWKDQHLKEKHNGNAYCGAIGGKFTFEFLPTSIGDIGTIKCDCGESFTFRELK